MDESIEHSDGPLLRDLTSLGFNERFQALFAPYADEGLLPGRVSRVDRGLPLVFTGHGEVRVEPATHLMKSADQAESRAVVGDWVGLTTPDGHNMPIMEAILPRASSFTRKDPGEATGEQVLAANVDIVFVVHALSKEPNLRRLERELVLAWESGARPIVLLTKADLWPEGLNEVLEHVASASPGVDVFTTSSVTGLGVPDIAELIGPGVTATMLGASGVGKSTLINRLVGEEVQKTKEIREVDGKGRHTTVAREMVPLPGGGILIDTPGMRALALWDASDGIDSAFPEIVVLAEDCRFRDCAHNDEPGCAVRAAVESGELPARRLDSYRSLTTELEVLAARQDVAGRSKKKREDKILAKTIRRHYRDHRHH
ncbi:MAG: ribosome small subunit-dependent GTPase A [Actinomycetota bacterium]|jgi:ribosome biogenesis GTPase|nr:ribosome small subunit-dependent GTPase A [Actinomycetota bacterium]